MSFEGKVKNMKLKIGDCFILAAVIAMAIFTGAYFLEKKESVAVAVVIQNGTVIERISLDELAKPHFVEVSDKYHNIIKADQDGIRFTEADCPDLVCVKTGLLTRPGQVAACLPSGLIIKIEGADSDIDAFLH